ncbi:hypothetical protein JKF63_06280 [Porcisia hertigi]|uniref:Uncharacterized protein n=1 Tax=Porcisia hertigi TaxID=2761500 RepID=A0A836IYU4_9TRYP|nr:hypothetical protein JKF63_06280 [Porcisia hertigi]
MPQQLPALWHGKDAQSSPLPPPVPIHSSGKNKSTSSGTTSRASVSASTIASVRRALPPPRAGCSVVVSSPGPQQKRETKSVSAGLSSTTVLSSKNMVSTSTTSVAATDSSPVPLGAPVSQSHIAAPAAAALEHLMYVANRSSLPRESYMPHAPDFDRGVKTKTSARADMLALRDATTSLFVQHIGLDNLCDLSKENEDSGDDDDSSDEDGGGRGEEKNNKTPPAISSALINTTPFMSAALQEVGVDDRVNPFILDKLIQESRRRARAAAAAEKRSTIRKKLLKHRFQGHTRLGSTAAALQQGNESMTAVADAAAAELRYHELPAIQAASEACCSATPENLGTRGGATSMVMTHSNAGESTATGAKHMTNPISEYTKELDAEESAGKTPFASVPGIYSTEDTHIAAAVSTSDGAFVRQLVGYYCARAAAISPVPNPAPAAVVEAPTQANLRSHRTRKNKNARADLNTAEGGCASPVFPFTPVTPAFSLLDAVMRVSREYVIQHSTSGVPNQSTSALSEQRRFLLNRLTSLEQTRIPLTWWITSLPYLGRLSSRTGAGSSVATTPARATAFVTTISAHSTSSGRLSSTDRTGRSERTEAPLPMDGGGSEQSISSGKEADTSPRDSIQKASMILTGLGDNAAFCGGGQLVFDAGTSRNTIFPAQRPVERSQVYLLAEVLDRMLRDPSHPRWLALLADPQVARYVLDDDGEDTDGGEQRGSGQGTLDPDLWGTPGEQRLAAYTDAATHVLDILDTGLAELGRQVASSCVERGALLDLLRQSTMDIASSHVRVLNQVKQQAHVDAREAQTLRKKNVQLQTELEETQKTLAELQRAHTALCARVEPLQAKSDRLDELMARAAAKTRRFDTSRHGQHTALLQVIMESITQSAGDAIDGFLTEVHNLQARHSGLEEGSGAESSNNGGVTSPGAAVSIEMPSVAVARSQAMEQRQTMEQLYTESRRLLQGLQDAVTATNTLCEPLYARMVLKDVSPAAKVATSRWTSVARAVGAFEKDKRHRQRVYDVFMEYCTSYRHKSAAKANLEAAQKGGAASANVGEGGVGGEKSYGESFLVGDSVTSRPNSGNSSTGAVQEYSEPSALLVSSRGTSADPQSQEKTSSSTRGVEDVDTDQAFSSSPPPSSSAEHEQIRNEAALAGAIVTPADLRAMNATDCTVDEVNALFRKGFDVKKYLRGSWEQYVQESQQWDHNSTGTVTATNNPGGKGVTAERTYTLSLADVLQMLSDVHATLAEITVRMNALTKSALVQAGLQPPLEPPSHPEQRCPLCNRRDTCELERQRRREAMSRIARDLQTKMDAVETKSRTSLAERDEALGEVRRLKMELQHSATAPPGRGPSGVGLQERQQKQEIQTGLFQGHQDQFLPSPGRKPASDSTTTVPPAKDISGDILGSASASLYCSLTATTATAEAISGGGMRKTSNKCTSPVGMHRVGFALSSHQENSAHDYEETPTGSSLYTASFDDNGSPSRRRSTAIMPVRSTRYPSSGSTTSGFLNTGPSPTPRRNSSNSNSGSPAGTDLEKHSNDVSVASQIQGGEAGDQKRQ